MNATSADGLPLHYIANGSGNAALVFVHGWCCDKSYWDLQTAHFAKKHKVVAIDLAGHGGSGTGRTNWTVRAFGEDVAAVVTQLGLEQVILVGHSMGGPVAVEAARLIPERVIGLVGVDTFQDINRKGVRAPSGDRLARFRENFVETTREMVRSMFLEKSDPELVDRIVSDMSSSPSNVGIGAMEGMIDYDLARAIENIRVPIRCICSDYRPFDLEAAEERASSFKISFMSGVGHFVMLEDAVTFNGMLEDIIDEIT